MTTISLISVLQNFSKKWVVTFYESCRAFFPGHCLLGVRECFTYSAEVVDVYSCLCSISIILSRLIFRHLKWIVSASYVYCSAKSFMLCIRQYRLWNMMLQFWNFSFTTHLHSQLLLVMCDCDINHFIKFCPVSKISLDFPSCGRLLSCDSPGAVWNIHSRLQQNCSFQNFLESYYGSYC